MGTEESSKLVDQIIAARNEVDRLGCRLILPNPPTQDEYITAFNKFSALAEQCPHPKVVSGFCLTCEFEVE